MKGDFKGLAGLCAASMAVMAMMMGLGLPGIPSLVMAQTPNLSQTCSAAAGFSGCYSCVAGGTQASGGLGCDGTTSPPGNFKVGGCVDGYKSQTCTSDNMDCGKWQKCGPNGGLTGGNCSSSIAICE